MMGVMLTTSPIAYHLIYNYWSNTIISLQTPPPIPPPQYATHGVTPLSLFLTLTTVDNEAIKQVKIKY